MACSSQSIHERISESLKLKIPENIDIEYEDSHGGFHGDGETIAIIKFTESQGDKILSDILKKGEWENLPLSESLELLMYGGEMNEIKYNFNLADQLDMPVIENGYYFFINRHPDSGSEKGDFLIFNQGSFNFTIGIYDVDTQTMYYLEFDT